MKLKPLISHVLCTVHEIWSYNDDGWSILMSLCPVHPVIPHNGLESSQKCHFSRGLERSHFVECFPWRLTVWPNGLEMTLFMQFLCFSLLNGLERSQSWLNVLHYDPWSWMKSKIPLYAGWSWKETKTFEGCLHEELRLLYDPMWWSWKEFTEGCFPWRT